MFEKTPYRPGLREVIKIAHAEASRLGHGLIGPEHLLLGIIRKGEGFAAQTLSDLGVDLDDLRRSVERLAEPPKPFKGERLQPSEAAVAVLDLAKETARRMEDIWVGTEHLLLAMVEEGKSAAARALQEFGLEYAQVYGGVFKVVAGPGAGNALSFGNVDRHRSLDGGVDPHQIYRKAGVIALNSGAVQMDSGHVLLAILDTPDSIGERALKGLDVDLAALRNRIEEEQNR